MKVTWRDILFNPVIAGFILLLSGIAVYLLFFTEPYTIKAKVVSHTTSSGRRGIVYYHTLIATDEGKTYSLEGEYYYARPVGSTIYYKTRKVK